MAKLTLICLTAVIIGFSKYIAGPVMLKEMDLDFIHSMSTSRDIRPPTSPPNKIVFHPTFPAQPLPPPDLPPEPENEPAP